MEGIQLVLYATWMDVGNRLSLQYDRWFHILISAPCEKRTHTDTPPHQKHPNTFAVILGSNLGCFLSKIQHLNRTDLRTKLEKYWECQADLNHGNIDLVVTRTCQLHFIVTRSLDISETSCHQQIGGLVPRCFKDF